MKYIDFVDPQDILCDGDEIMPGVIFHEVPGECFICGTLTHTVDLYTRDRICSVECRDAVHTSRRAAQEAGPTRDELFGRIMSLGGDV